MLDYTQLDTANAPFYCLISQLFSVEMLIARPNVIVRM